MEQELIKAEHGGARRGAGRPPGAANILTRELKGMILGALDDAGGQAYLLEQAKNNPNAFMQLIGKILPAELTAKAEDGAQVTISLGIGRD